MKYVDVFLRQKIYDIDLYLRQLPLMTENSLYLDLILSTQCKLLTLYKPMTASNNSMLLDSKINAAVITVYNAMKNSQRLSSYADAFVARVLEGSSVDMELGVSATDIDYKSFATLSHSISLLTEKIIPNYIFETVNEKISNGFALYSRVLEDPDGHIMYASLQWNSQLINDISAPILKFYNLFSDKLAIGSSVSDMFITRYRTFANLDETTFLDLEGKTMNDFVFISA